MTNNDKFEKLLCILFFSVFIFIIYAFIFLTPGPEPTIILHDVKLYAFNVSTPTNTLTSNLQITIFCQNTDIDTGIHFEKIDVYASYKNQQITPSTTIPRAYVSHPDVTVWSPYLNGTAVPVNSDIAKSLVQDLNARAVLINVMARGRLRANNGFRSVSYQMEVNCPAYVKFGKKNNDSSVVGSAIKVPFVEGCHTHVEV